MVLLLSPASVTMGVNSFIDLKDILTADSYSLKNDLLTLYDGNHALAKLFRSGDINKIYDKWILPIGLPMSNELKILFAMQTFPE